MSFDLTSFFSGMTWGISLTVGTATFLYYRGASVTERLLRMYTLLEYNYFPSNSNETEPEFRITRASGWYKNEGIIKEHMILSNPDLDEIHFPEQKDGLELGEIELTVSYNTKLYRIPINKEYLVVENDTASISRNIPLDVSLMHGKRNTCIIREAQIHSTSNESNEDEGNEGADGEVEEDITESLLMYAGPNKNFWSNHLKITTKQFLDNFVDTSDNCELVVTCLYRGQERTVTFKSDDQLILSFDSSETSDVSSDNSDGFVEVDEDSTTEASETPVSTTEEPDSITEAEE